MSELKRAAVEPAAPRCLPSASAVSRLAYTRAPEARVLSPKCPPAETEANLLAGLFLLLIQHPLRSVDPSRAAVCAANVPLLSRSRLARAEAAGVARSGQGASRSAQGPPRQ